MAKHPEQTAITRANLCEAFWRLYADTPIEKITVGAVTERAGYHRGTFYLHFRDVYEVLETIEDGLIADMRACVETCMRELEAGVDAEEAMQRVFAFYEEKRDYIVVLLGSHGDPRFAERLKSELKPLWARYVLKRDDPGEEDLVLEYTLSGALFMISRWLENPHGVSAEKLLHLLYHRALGR